MCLASSSFVRSVRINGYACIMHSKVACVVERFTFRVSFQWRGGTRLETWSW
jgi:hypothetical protein